MSKQPSITLHLQTSEIHFIGYEMAFWCPLCGVETLVSKPMYGMSLDCPNCKTHYSIAPYADCTFESPLLEQYNLQHGVPV